MMAAKPCFTCDAVTEHWVLWANARGDMHTFCDNECLSWWIECCREEARQARAMVERFEADGMPRAGADAV